jgi:hypothetical protein
VTAADDLKSLLDKRAKIQEVYDDLNWDRRTAREPENSRIRGEMGAVRQTLNGIDAQIIALGGEVPDYGPAGVANYYGREPS